MRLWLAAGLTLAATWACAYEFTFAPRPDVTQVSVGGVFNDWYAERNPMSFDANRQLWTLDIPLEPGRYAYKFVLNASQWILDPANPLREDDGQGNVNSILVLLPKEYAQPARAGDGKITAAGIRHEPLDKQSFWDRGVLRLVVRVRPNDVQRVVIVPEGGKPVTARVSGVNEVFETRLAELPWDRAKPLEYRVKIVDGAKFLWLGPYRLDPQKYPIVTPPKWVENTVFYQIFPDRFANGSRANDLGGEVSWNAAPTWWNYFGGDFAGIRSKIGYLEDLGIGAIYLNPIFESKSNHRYDTRNYERVDPRLGTNDEFAELSRVLESHGIRTVLDGVFGHTGTDFHAFANLREQGANSRYKDWYHPYGFPIVMDPRPNYMAWYGFPSMPKLNHANPEVQAMVRSVVQGWMRRARVHGWRLDTANEVDPSFWRQFRKDVKSQDPNAWIVGETWGAAHGWLQGDQWDSAMNYPFRDLAIRFFAQDRIGAKAFLQGAVAQVESHPPQVARNLLNALSTHDTPRFLALAGEDPRRLRLATVALMTWVGAPSIYYGDELGMSGGADPNNRRAMRWDLVSPKNKTLDWTRRLVRLRNHLDVLKSGDLIPVFADDSTRTLAYARRLDRDVAVVVLNASSRARSLTVPLPAALRGRLTGASDLLFGTSVRVSPGQVRLTLPPFGAAVLARPVLRSSDAPSASAPALSHQKVKS